MRHQTRRGVAGVLALLILAIPVGAGGPDERPAERKDRLPADAARMYRLVTTRHPGELRWQQTPG